MSAGADRRRWLVSSGLALALHIAVFGLIAGWPRHAMQPAPLPMQAVMVDMAPAPVAPTAPPTALPPGPPRREQLRHQRMPRPHPPMVPPPPPAKAATDAIPATPPQQPVAPPASLPAAEVERTTAPPSVQAPAAPHVAAPHATDAAGRSDAITWQSVLLGHLAKYRRYPARAERSRQQGTAYVQFTVDRQGNVLDARLDRSSGHPLLDQETMATVQRASPVPPPPPAVPGNPVEVVVPVVFSLRGE